MNTDRWPQQTMLRPNHDRNRGYSTGPKWWDTRRDNLLFDGGSENEDGPALRLLDSEFDPVLLDLVQN